MKFIKETFLNLTPPNTKIKRTSIAGYSGLYLEQNKTGYTFQYSFKSPVTGNCSCNGYSNACKPGKHPKTKWRDWATTDKKKIVGQWKVSW